MVETEILGEQDFTFATFYTVITRMTCIETEYVISIYHFTTHGGKSHKLLSLNQQSSCYMCLVLCGDTCYSVCWTWKSRFKKMKVLLLILQLHQGTLRLPFGCLTSMEMENWTLRSFRR